MPDFRRGKTRLFHKSAMGRLKQEVQKCIFFFWEKFWFAYSYLRLKSCKGGVLRPMLLISSKAKLKLAY